MMSFFFEDEQQNLFMKRKSSNFSVALYSKINHPKIESKIYIFDSDLVWRMQIIII